MTKSTKRHGEKKTASSGASKKHRNAADGNAPLVEEEASAVTELEPADNALEEGETPSKKTRDISLVKKKRSSEAHQRRRMKEKLKKKTKKSVNSTDKASP